MTKPVPFQSSFDDDITKTKEKSKTKNKEKEKKNTKTKKEKGKSEDNNDTFTEAFQTLHPNKKLILELGYPASNTTTRCLLYLKPVVCAPKPICCWGTVILKQINDGANKCDDDADSFSINWDLNQKRNKAIKVK